MRILGQMIKAMAEAMAAHLSQKTESVTTCFKSRTLKKLDALFHKGLMSGSTIF
jgi:hypothetical protein